MDRKKTSRKKQNRRLKQRASVSETVGSVVKDKEVVRGSLAMIGFLAVFGCIALVTWVTGKMADPATLTIKSVKVEGQYKYLSTSTLESLVANNVEGGFFTLDVEKVRGAVMQAPWVREATVRKLWPDTLYVKIKEQNAVVRWGDKGFLNQKGALFTPEDTTNPKGLITLTGPEGTHKLVFEKYKTLMGLLNPSKRSVAWVELNSRRGWRFKINNGPTVIVGRKDVDERLWKYVKNVEGLLGQAIINIAQVDLRYANGFTVREREKEVEEMTQHLSHKMGQVQGNQDSRGT